MNAPVPLPIRRATLADAPRVAQLLAAAFARDPVFDWLTRTGRPRQRALQRFFAWMLESRALPYNETWITADGFAAAAWIPPYGIPGRGLVSDLRILPRILQLTGLTRLPRGAAMAAAMEHAHPEEPFFYLAFLGVAPRVQGTGLGSALLRQTLARADAAGVSAYLENSNPRNLKLYEAAGFSVVQEVKARKDAPPVFAMRRPAKPVYGSSTMSQ
jgi:ribosomal protein S18 acetylase RimI-like enzyme